MKIEKLVVIIFISLISPLTLIQATPKLDSLKQLIRYETSEDTSLCRHLYEIANLYKNVQLDSMLAYIEQLSELANSIESKEYQERADYLLVSVEMQKGNLFLADSLLHILIEKEKKFPTPPSYYVQQAVIKVRLNRIEEAMETLQKLYTLSKQAEVDKKYLVNYHTIMGAIYHGQNEMGKAFEQAQLAYQYALESKNSTVIITPGLNLVIYYQLFEEFDKIESLLLELAALNNNLENQIAIYRRLMINNINLKQATQAHYYFDKILKIRKETGRTDMLDVLYFFKSRAFIIENKLDSAYHYATESLKIAIVNNAPEQISDCHYAFANINFLRGEYQAALQHYQQTDGSSITPYIVSEEIATTYAKLGNWEAAYEQLRNSKEEHDVIFDKKSLLATNAKLVRNQFQLEQEQRELITQQKEATYQAQIARQREFLGFSGFIILLLGLGTYLVYNSYQTIRQQKAELEQANSIKNKIFAILGHDLRTPAGNIDMMLGEALNGNLSKTEFWEFLPMLKKGSAAMFLTLNNILFWGLAQAKKIEYFSSMVNIRREVSVAQSLSEGLIQQKQITFIDNTPDNLVIETDQAKLNLILRNLIANSIKYTPNEGTIEINSITTNDDAVVISVRDTGVGMDEATQSKIFDNPRSKEGTNAEKGTGIGLNLCKQMIEDLGGSIWVDSKLNYGSTFSFSLPVIAS